MSVLRVYRISECDNAGVPLGWERCQACEGRGSFPEEDVGGNQWREPCEDCDGHGSLHAAARAGREAFTNGGAWSLEPRGNLRCEGCCHPMSDGTWEGAGPDRFTPEALAAWLSRIVCVPHDDLPVHLSPCDSGCRHGGLRNTRQVEASWRPVDVRCLSWPHDLRPESLAVLCLRCWATLTRKQMTVRIAQMEGD